MTPFRVCSVPHSHPYVRRVTAHDRIEVLGDPTGRGDGRLVFDPDWVTANAPWFDVVHVHFGFERLTPGQLGAWLEAVDRSDVPLVVSVHDLRNPHLVDNRRQEELLDLLVPAADDVLTLTSAAARVVRDRWQRTATVLPHPRVATVEAMRRARRRRRGREQRIGLHLKSLRANFAAEEAVAALADVLAVHPRAVVDVRLHRDVAEQLRPVLRTLGTGRPGRSVVHTSDYLPDDQLFDWIGSLDVLLLPYRWGTHSGWIEMGKDLATRVVTPDLPTYREQGATSTFAVDDEAPTATAMRAAVMEALATPLVVHDPDDRLVEERAVVEGHLDVYAAAVARRAARQPTALAH